MATLCPSSRASSSSDRAPWRKWALRGHSSRGPWNRVSVTYRDPWNWAPPQSVDTCQVEDFWGGAVSHTKAPSQSPDVAAHLTSCGSILGCSQKAWSSGLSLRMADSEGTRAVTRLSAGRVMPAPCAHGVGGGGGTGGVMKAATTLRSLPPASRPAPHLQPLELLCGLLDLSPQAQHSIQSYLDPLVEDGEVGICLQLLRGGKKLKSPV